eukprot:gene28427-31701_t
MNGVDLQAWLADVLARIADHPVRKLDELLPWKWNKAGARIDAACRQLIADVLRPRFLPEIRPNEFNYPVDILGKWRGAQYRFIQRYRSGFAENLGEEFDAPFGRLDWIGHESFDIQWHRHTGQWFRLYTCLTLVQALHALESDGLLHPL